MMSKLKELLCITDEDICFVRSIYDKTEDAIQADINLLLEWLDKQSHLPKNIDRARLERFLVRNKFRIEQTKIKLDNYYSFKVFYPDFLTYLDPESQVIEKLRKSMIVTLMPKLLPSSQRIFYLEINKNIGDNINWLALTQYLYFYWELQLTYDYSASSIYICNLKNVTFKQITALEPNLAHSWFHILQKGYSGRLFQVHYIHLSQAANILINLLKRVVNAKVFEKIKLHPDYDSLHKDVPKEYLPAEVEGNMGSAKDLSDKWFEEILLQKEFLKTNIEESSNEKLRIGQSIYSDMFGVDGTFRKINID